MRKAKPLAPVEFKAEKDSIKSLPMGEKWKALKEGKLLADDRVRGKKIILLDDKYQSGITAQAVASAMYDAGAAEINGVFCVKTWRNTDNQ